MEAPDFIKDVAIHMLELIFFSIEWLLKSNLLTMGNAVNGFL